MGPALRTEARRQGRNRAPVERAHGEGAEGEGLVKQNEWDELAGEIHLTENGCVIYTSRAKNLMANNGIDADSLHTAIEDCSGVDQNGEDWIDWDCVIGTYDDIERARK
jgi:hypothetical protein